MTRFPRIPAAQQRLRGVEPGHVVAWSIAAGVASLAVGAVSVELLVAAAAVGALFVLALRDLSLGVVAVVASVPVQTVASFDLGGSTLTWTKLTVLATLAAWSVRIVTGHSRPRFDGLAAAFGCYVLVLTASIVEARNLSAWAEEVYRWAVALAIYLIAAESLRGIVAARRVILVIAAAVMIMSGVAAWQVATRAGPATFSIAGVTRAYGTFGEPNPFAGYLEMTVLFLVAVVLGSLAGERERKRPPFLGQRTLVIALAASLTGTAALLATQSRGGYLGFAIGLGVVVWLTGGKVRWLGTVGGGICLLALLVSPYGVSLSARFRADSLTTSQTQVTTGNFAAQERSAHWRAAVTMARSSPILGIGAGNFDERYRESTSVWRFRIPRGHAHNAYLQALAQAGILGFLSYLTLLAVVASSIMRTLKRAGDPLVHSVIVGVAAVTAAVAIHNGVEYLHVLSLGLQLSVLWALLHLDRPQSPGRHPIPVTAE